VTIPLLNVLGDREPYSVFDRQTYAMNSLPLGMADLVSGCGVPFRVSVCYPRTIPRCRDPEELRSHNPSPRDLIPMNRPQNLDPLRPETVSCRLRQFRPSSILLSLSENHWLRTPCWALGGIEWCSVTLDFSSQNDQTPNCAMYLIFHVSKLLNYNDLMN